MDAPAAETKLEVTPEVTGEVTGKQQDLAAPARDADLPAAVLAALLELQESFDAKIRYDEAKERQITALHKELESHRQGLYQRILQPVLTDLIGIYDEAANQPGEAAGSLPEAIEAVLERYGVTRYACEDERVDRARQKVISVEPTGDAGLNRKVARRLRPGFEADGKVLRPEWVVAYRYEAGAGQPDGGELPDGGERNGEIGG